MSKHALNGMYVTNDLISLNGSKNEVNKGSEYVSGVDTENVQSNRNYQTALSTLSSYDSYERESQKAYQQKMSILPGESLNRDSIKGDSGSSRNSGKNQDNVEDLGMSNSLNVSQNYLEDVAPTKESLSFPVAQPLPQLHPRRGSQPYLSMNDALSRNLQISGLLDDVNLAFDARQSSIHTRLQELSTSYGKQQGLVQVNNSASISQKQQQERDRSWITRLEGQVHGLEASVKQQEERTFLFDERLSNIDRQNHARFLHLERAVAEQGVQMSELASTQSNVQRELSVQTEERSTVLHVVEGLSALQGECAADRRQLGLVQADMKALQSLWTRPQRCVYCKAFSITVPDPAVEDISDGSNAGTQARMNDLGIVVHCLKCDKLHCARCEEHVHDNLLSQQTNVEQNTQEEPVTWAAVLFQYVHSISKKHHSSQDHIQRSRLQIVKERLEAWATQVDTKVAALARDVKPVVETQIALLDKQRTMMVGLKNLHKQVMDVRAFELSTSGALTTELQDLAAKMKQAENDRQTPAMTSVALSRCPHCAQVPSSTHTTQPTCTACREPLPSQTQLSSGAMSGRIDVAVQRLLTLKQAQVSKKPIQQTPIQLKETQYTKQAAENTEKIKNILSGSQNVLPPLKK